MIALLWSIRDNVDVLCTLVVRIIFVILFDNVFRFISRLFRCSNEVLFWLLCRCIDSLLLLICLFDGIELFLDAIVLTFYLVE